MHSSLLQYVVTLHAFNVSTSAENAIENVLPSIHRLEETGQKHW